MKQTRAQAFSSPCACVFLSCFMLPNLSLALSRVASDYVISGQLREIQEQQYVTHNTAAIIVKRGISVKCQIKDLYCQTNNLNA